MSDEMTGELLDRLSTTIGGIEHIEQDYIFLERAVFNLEDEIRELQYSFLGRLGFLDKKIGNMVEAYREMRRMMARMWESIHIELTYSVDTLTMVEDDVFEDPEWIVNTRKDGEPLKKASYSCPFCDYKVSHKTKYCPNCGLEVGLD